VQCTVNKQEIGQEQLQGQQLLLLGGPRLPFTGHELQHIRHYVENGGNAMIIMQEGGENRLDTNINFSVFQFFSLKINAFLEQVGISVNGDSVIRKHFYKYLHPKEAFIGNGILNKELVRVAKGEAKTT
jgi:intraflagellar transport protein 52